MTDPYLAFVGFYTDWSSEMEGDKEFYASLAAEAGRMVELGAGNGRVAIPCALAGADVIAVDISQAMIDDGRKRAADAGAADRITWVHEDMRRYVASPPVPLVTIPFRSFLHMATVEDQLAALRNVHASLEPGGRLALNVFIPDPATIASQDGRKNFHASFSDERGRRCEMHAIPRYETGTQRIRMTAMCEVFDGERLVETAQADLELRMVYRFEMLHLLARCGFAIEAEYGWFDRRAVEADSRELVVVARKV
jgi:SAM-dependent methyltransferase